MALGCGGADSVCNPCTVPFRSGNLLPFDLSTPPFMLLPCGEFISPVRRKVYSSDDPCHQWHSMSVSNADERATHP